MQTSHIIPGDDFYNNGNDDETSWHGMTHTSTSVPKRLALERGCINATSSIGWCTGGVVWSLMAMRCLRYWAEILHHKCQVFVRRTGNMLT